ncbi:MAG TPA: caspase family protein [Bryobacteraceae bacterium]|jgi:hypothetical protein|nr:caspase family protein [Bryobacteraceae bacterium]
MQRLSPYFAVLLSFGFAGSCWAACGDTEQDRLVWARERMHPDASTGQLQLVYQWLLNSTRSCPFSGDLWYYRGLVAKRLSEGDDAQYAFRKAGDNHSTAQTQSFDPFRVVNRGPTPKTGAIMNKYALIIGVGTFQNSDDFLEFSAKDARDLGAFLVKSGKFRPDHVTVLADQDATTSKIREAFGNIRAEAKEDDLVLIYFSSHGRPRDLDPTGLSYVLTYDTDTSTPGRVFATALEMVELAELGRWVLARDYVLLLDTCYSGAARAGAAGKLGPQGANGLDPLQGLAGSGNRVVISASRADEQSYEDENSKHGYFTRFLLEALGKDSTPQPLSSIFSYLQAHLSPEVAHIDGRQQHPVMQTFGQGENIILNAPALSAFNLPRPRAAR